jgi:N-acetyl-gamma-glutamyl-phosphate reductase
VNERGRDPAATNASSVRPRALEASRRQPLAGAPVARACVVGASGYAGALSAHLLWNHPRIALEAVTARTDAGRALADLYPRYRVPLTLETLDLDRPGALSGGLSGFAGLNELDVALVSYPHGAAAEVVAALRELGLRVVDLSADFRLRDPEAYAAWYGDHGAPALLDGAVFGLTELHRAEVSGADLVANPGCYSTAAILALAPLARAGVIEDAVIDAKSGVSGAGRAATDTTHFVSVDENVTPYGVEAHRHAAEIDQELEALGFSEKVTFTPHLLPLDQGLLASCYVTTTRPLDADELFALYVEAYGGERFIELTHSPPGVRDVRDTNICRIGTAVERRTGRALVFAAIDNLWKGAAGQAVQNLNLMLGLDEAEGLR